LGPSISAQEFTQYSFCKLPLFVSLAFLVAPLR
jgi:hypothetical protein